MPERRKAERRKGDRRLAGPRFNTTREEIINAARNFPSNGELPNWTTLVNGRELPARVLVLRAAKVPDNDPTDAIHAAVILSDLGFEVRYKGTTIPPEDLPDLT